MLICQRAVKEDFAWQGDGDFGSKYFLCETVLTWTHVTHTNPLTEGLWCSVSDGLFCSDPQAVDFRVIWNAYMTSLHCCTFKQVHLMTTANVFCRLEAPGACISTHWLLGVAALILKVIMIRRYLIKVLHRMSRDNRNTESVSLFSRHHEPIYTLRQK